MDSVGICDKCNRNLPVCCGEEVQEPASKGGQLRRRGVCKNCCPEHGPRKAIRPPPPPVMPKPATATLSGIDWKKRALAAEAKLAGYKRLRDVAEQAMREQDLSTAALDSLADELYHLDRVDPAKDFFDQVLSKIDPPITIRRDFDLNAAVASFDPVARVIAVSSSASQAAQVAGLLYQLLQAADMACVTNGLEGERARPEWLQTRTGPILALLLAAGLLNPALPVEYGEIALLPE